MAKKYAFIFFFFILFFQTAHAQILQPVKWQFSAEITGANEYTLIWKATVDEGWKIYSQDIKEGGPIPTSINFENIPTGVELIGKIEELGKLEENIEPLFDNLMLRYYHKRVTLRQKVKVTQDAKLSGYLEFMTCDDKQCLPPESIDFAFDLKFSTASANTNNINTIGQTNFLEPVKWKISRDSISINEYAIVFKATIEEGWKLYSQKTKLNGRVPLTFVFQKSPDYELIGKVIEVSIYEEKEEPLFDNTILRYFKHEAVFKQTIKLLSPEAVLKGNFEFITCDATQCLPSELKEFALNLKSGQEEIFVDTSAAQIDTVQVNFQVDAMPLKNCNIDDIADTEEAKSSSLLTIFFLGFVGGLLALLTPCVFPMIPLTVSFFTKRSQNKSKGIFEALFYGFCIILIYALLALPFVIYELPPDTLNEISTNIYLNIFFFVIFLVFAFSFFGFYEITLPNSWLNKADSASNVGGLVGIFFMALTLALVSFSCTGPILGSLLVGSLSSDSGQMSLMAGMIGFGAALALPFALFAAFPQMMQKLPKSGGWLNSVKVVLGFIEVALAFKFLSNADLVAHWGILKREIFFAIWALCSLGIFLYLIGVIKFPHDSPGKKKLSPIIIFLALVFLGLGSYFAYGIKKGTNLSLASGFAPPMFYSIYPQDTHCPLGLNCFHDFDEAKAYAKEVNKPIMIDFTGWACVNCRKMEEHVWPEEIIYKYIHEEFVLVSLYVDDKESLPDSAQYISAFSGKKIRTIGNKWSDFQSSYFKINSQPYYVLISPEGKVLNQPVGYTPDAKQYEAFLKCGLDAYKELQIGSIK